MAFTIKCCSQSPSEALHLSLAEEQTGSSPFQHVLGDSHHAEKVDEKGPAGSEYDWMATGMTGTRIQSEASSIITLQNDGSEGEIVPDEIIKTWSSHQDKAPAGAIKVLNIPTDRRRLLEPSFDGAEFQVHLEAPLKQQLASLARDNGSDLTTVMLVAWSVVLSRLSGEDSIDIGMGD
ncbi:hypothetical protein BGX26_006964, partial [Mortierella sp. AD094]